MIFYKYAQEIRQKAQKMQESREINSRLHPAQSKARQNERSFSEKKTRSAGKCKSKEKLLQSAVWQNASNMKDI